MLVCLRGKLILKGSVWIYGPKLWLLVHFFLKPVHGLTHMEEFWGLQSRKTLPYGHWVPCLGIERGILTYT